MAQQDLAGVSLMDLTLTGTGFTAVRNLEDTYRTPPSKITFADPNLDITNLTGSYVTYSSNFVQCSSATSVAIPAIKEEFAPNKPDITDPIFKNYSFVQLPSSLPMGTTFFQRFATNSIFGNFNGAPLTTQLFFVSNAVDPPFPQTLLANNVWFVGSETLQL